MKYSFILPTLFVLLVFSSNKANYELKCSKDDINTFLYGYDASRFPDSLTRAMRAYYDSLYPPDPDLVDDDCTYKGFKLYGKIKVVENFPDLKVKIVENFPDLKVKLVNSFPDDCGEWQMVENFPDLKIQFVENFPDIKIKYVDNFPGKP